MNANLLPCAFCGATPFAFPRTCDRTTPYNPAHRAFPYVRCRCGTCVDGLDWTGPETAIAAWNERAKPAAEVRKTLTQLCFVIRGLKDAPPELLAACEGAEKVISNCMGSAR